MTVPWVGVNSCPLYQSYRKKKLATAYDWFDKINLDIKISNC